MRNDANPAPQLTVEPGLTTPPPAHADIDYYVRLFLPDEVFDFLAAESNRYAAQYLATQMLGPHARAQAWKPATRSDMKRFIATYFLSGIVRKSQLQQYWSHDVYLETPWFGRIMSRDRFLLLLQFLHFYNNEAATPGDRLAKLRPLTDMMFGLFERLYTPHQFISIDEELVLLKGRLLFKQFIPSKRARFGLKIFALCDTHGYFYTASVYTGQPNPPRPHTDTVRTNKRNRQGQVIKRLRVNHEYNSRMGGVDKNDATVTSVSGLRKTLKWYIKVGMHFLRRPFKMPTSPTVSKVGGSNTTISSVKLSMSMSMTLKKPVSQHHTKHYRTGWLESTSFKRIRRQLSVNMLCGNVLFVRPVDFAENHATSARPATTTLASVLTHATRSIILPGSTNSIVWRYVPVFSSSIFSLLKTNALPKPISLFLSNCYTFRRLHELL